MMCLFRYHTDPSGTFIKYEAKAIGSGSEAAQSELQDKWHKASGIAALITLPSAYTERCE